MREGLIYVRLDECKWVIAEVRDVMEPVHKMPE
jgi:hypothetical protein